MFNLEQSISEWRKQMLAAGIKTPVPLEELECHLREEIERQMRAGSNAQVAFDTAVGQIGKGRELKTEFARTKPLRNILEFELIKKEWALKWAPVFHVVIFTTILLYFCGMVLFQKAGFSGMTPGPRISSLGAAAVAYLLFNAGLLGHRFFPVIPGNYARLAIYSVAGFLVSLWLMFFISHVNANINQFNMEFSWAFFVPIGAFSGLTLGLERAAYKKAKMAG